MTEVDSAAQVSDRAWLPASRRVRMQGPAIVGALALGGCALLLAVDPNQSGHYPTCPTKLVTGFDCPFCGGLRCTRSLLTGNITGAIDHNALVVLLAPFAVVAWVLWVRRAWIGPRTDRVPWSRTQVRLLTWSVVAVAVAWTIFRNLPIGAYFASGVA